MLSSLEHSRLHTEHRDRGRLLSRRTAVASGVVALVSSFAAGLASDAGAQPSDVEPKKPNVLLVVDTSASMLKSLASGNADCATGTTSRYVMLAEALTGSINDLVCDNSIAVESNYCRPYLNNLAAMSPLLPNTGAWPQIGGNPNEADPIVFCGKNNNRNRCDDTPNWSASVSSQICKVKNGEWEQVGDGLLDPAAYGGRVRFGLMTVDSVAMQLNRPLTAPLSKNALDYWYQPINRNSDPCYGGPAGCQLAVDGAQCRRATFNVFVDPTECIMSNTRDRNHQYSYWHDDTGDTWLVPGSRASYPEQILSMVNHNVTLLPLPGTQYLTAGTQVDAGVRNSKAKPNQGRLIGFGPQEWTIAAPLTSVCTNEDQCTQVHNDMVQRAVLGLGAYDSVTGFANAFVQTSTPLASMMRDVRDFLADDDTTEGVHVPHPSSVSNAISNATVGGKIGLKNDGYSVYVDPTDGCRDTAVVVMADADNNGNALVDPDIDEKAAYYSADLFAKTSAPVYTIALGDLTSIAWSDDPVGLLANRTTDCTALAPNAATFTTAGEMCHTAVAGRYTFAEPPYSLQLGVEANQLKFCCQMIETALNGGGKSYFPSNDLALKQTLNSIMSIASTKVISRTQPVFAPAASIYPGEVNAKGNYFEIRSSVSVTDQDTMWRGQLERVRYACDGTSGLFVPVAQDVDVSKSDSFGANIDASGDSRRFLVVAPKRGVAWNPNIMLGTLRPVGASNPNTKDGLFSVTGLVGDFQRMGNVNSNGNDELVTANSLVAEVNSLTGSGFSVADAAEMMAIENPTFTASNKAACGAVANCGGGGDAQLCANAIVSWYGGKLVPNACSGTMPSRIPTSVAGCPSGSCSSMGGIYRSSPIIVSPPEQYQSDDSNFGAIRSGASPSFYENYKERPTMVYQQTTDGQLHAFVLAENDVDPADSVDFDASATGVNGVGVPIPNVTSPQTMNELWTFIPPAVMPNIFPNFNVQVRMTDGPLASSEVIYARDYGGSGSISSTDTISWPYNTVIVGASGTSALGGFYYALDVTDPRAPRFLWQMSYAGNGANGEPGDRLFGSSAPGAAITHVRFRDGTTDRVVAVAVLPGGESTTAALSGTVARAGSLSYWTTSRKPRTQIRNWGTSGVPARSLTFVELSTGRIIARLVGHANDNPPLDSDVVVPPANTPFDSPITGIPAPYPNGTGAIADRIYVGDADGTLWRVNVSNPDVKQWKAHIAFDAYNTGSSGAATLMDATLATNNGTAQLSSAAPPPPSTDTAAAVIGQPIQTAPLLSLNDTGNVVVSFSTGDQEDFNTVSDGMINLLVSFSDTFDTSVPDPFYKIVLDSDEGVELAWLNGARVTGPINLFDGQLYFAYFTPSNSSDCLKGRGGLCGLNYIKRSSYDPIAYTDLDADSSPDTCVDFPGGEVVFGVSINLLPSCDPGEDTFPDPWLGGSYKTITQSNMGKYQLSFHTGQLGDGKNNAISPSDTRDLPLPKQKTRVKTWVSVIE